MLENRPKSTNFGCSFKISLSYYKTLKIIKFSTKLNKELVTGKHFSTFLRLFNNYSLHTFISYLVTLLSSKNFFLSSGSSYSSTSLCSKAPENGMISAPGSCLSTHSLILINLSNRQIFRKYETAVSCPTTMGIFLYEFLYHRKLGGICPTTSLMHVMISYVYRG